MKQTLIQQIATQIREQRLEQNMTQLELAEKMNLSRVLINRWENGHKEPKLSHLQKMNKIFNFEFNLN